jgi:hypothetical protein
MNIFKKYEDSATKVYNITGSGSTSQSNKDEAFVQMKNILTALGEKTGRTTDATIWKWRARIREIYGLPY